MKYGMVDIDWAYIGAQLGVGERLAIRRVVTEGAELIRVFQALTKEENE